MPDGRLVVDFTGWDGSNDSTVHTKHGQVSTEIISGSFRHLSVDFDRGICADGHGKDDTDCQGDARQRAPRQ